MSRLIDADELKEVICRSSVDTREKIENIIDNAPTVVTDNKEYSQGFKDGKECTLVSIDAIEDITDRMVSIISEIDWEKTIEAYKARPQGEWILIPERLPDRFDDVLVTVLTASGEIKVRSGFYADEHFFLDTGAVWKWNDPEVKAWMPLPEPYKEAENE